MPSVFLSHTSVDKPFVEKLARDLRRIGVNAWFDKWEIKVGDSITWKIEQGIRENEYLAIVLSPEALTSEWVRSELSAGWVKQMQSRRVVVLPILYRHCDIPLFLADRKYADFRESYQKGFTELAAVLGIKASEMISQDNWRRFVRTKNSGWQGFRDAEFRQLVDVLITMAKEYNWSTWTGASRTPYSITLSAHVEMGTWEAVSVRIDGKTHAYVGSLVPVVNPNYLGPKQFDIYVGNTVDECEEFVWRILEDFRQRRGDPPGLSEHSVGRYIPDEKLRAIATRTIRDLRSESKWHTEDDDIQ